MKKTVAAFFLCFIGMFTLQAFAEDTINIAAIYAQTGEAAEANIPLLHGVHLGVDEINKRGGVLGKKIKLLVFDNRSTPIGSSVAAEKAAAANVVAIVGASWSSHSIAVANVVQSRGIPMVSSDSTNPKVTKIGDYIFRVCFTDDFQGSVMARFARRDLKANTAVAFIDLTSDYSMGLAEVFRKEFEQLGGKVLLELGYKHKQKKFEQIILQAKRADPDVLFIPGHDESGLIVKQAQYAGIPSIPLGGDGWNSRSFSLKGGMELKKGYYCTHWSERMDSEPSRAFVAQYKNIGGIIDYTALAYDAVFLVADAIKRAGSIDRAKIRQAIAETPSFKGVTGTISFDAHGDPVKSAVIMEIKDGKAHYFKTVEP